MQVTFTIAGLNPETGGPARSVPALCSALADSQVIIELVSLDYGTSVGNALLPANSSVRTTLVDCSSRWARRFQWTPAFRSALRERCRISGSQIIHDTGLWLPSNHAATAISRRFRIPRIVSPRGMLSVWALQHRGWKKRIAWLLYQRRDLRSAKVLHATSRDEADEFRTLGLTQPIAIIPNGVDLPSVSQPSTLNSQPKARIALFLSRIHPKKGLLDLVSAWKSAEPKGWQVVIAGGDDGNHLSQVKAAVAQQGLTANFLFVGAVEGEAKWKLYRQSNLFVLPSYSENFGIVIAEALASGIPVITTKATPWQEMIEHRCGWWVNPGATSLAVALKDAMALSDSERQQMGERGRQLIQKNYAWSHVATEMKSVYAWVLGISGKPNCVLE